MVGGSILGGLFGRSASKKAAQAQQQAAAMSTNELRRQFDVSRADMAPWMEAGRNALAQLRQLTAPGGDLMAPMSMIDDPGYQFGLGEGLDAINANMAARGMRKSGAANKALARYATDYAGTKYNDAFNRDMASKNQIYNMLAGQAGMGQSTANQVASMGMNTANNVANIGLQSGNAIAAGHVGSANAITDALDGVSSYARMRMLLGK